MRDSVETALRQRWDNVETAFRSEGQLGNSSGNGSAEGAVANDGDDGFVGFGDTQWKKVGAGRSSYFIYSAGWLVDWLAARRAEKPGRTTRPEGDVRKNSWQSILPESSRMRNDAMPMQFPNDRPIRPRTKLEESRCGERPLGRGFKTG